MPVAKETAHHGSLGCSNPPLESTLLNALLETAVCSRSAEAARILMQQAEVDAGLVIHLILKAVENLHAECEEVLLEVSDEE